MHGILTKEETDKTFEFLNVKPISRTKILTAKLCAVVVNIVVLNLVTLVTSIMCVISVSDDTSVIGKVVEVMVGMLFIQFIFASLGMFMYAILKKTKGAAITSGVVLITFFLSRFIEMNEKIDFLKFFTPFRYFDAGKVIFETGIEFGFILLSVGLIALFLIGAYRFYGKKDLNV